MRSETTFKKQLFSHGQKGIYLFAQRYVPLGQKEHSFYVKRMLLFEDPSNPL